MANTSSAKKAARQNPKRHEKNVIRKSSIKTAVKKVLDAVENKDKNMVDLLRDAEAKLSRAKGKGVIDARTASRKVSRLAKKVSEASR